MSYTPLQQDRQARNRPTHKPPPFPPTGDTPGSRARPSASTSAANQAAFAAEASDEKFEEREQRTRAAKILESNEMLIWHSLQANEPMSQTRLRFSRLLAGFSPDPTPRK